MSHTKQTDKPKVDEDGAPPIPRACPHEDDNKKYGHGQVNLKWQCRDGVQYVMGIQLGLLLLRTQNNSDNTGDGNNNAPEVPLTKSLMEHGGSDDAV